MCQRHAILKLHYKSRCAGEPQVCYIRFMQKLGFNIVLLGMITSGKDTQAKILEKKYNVQMSADAVKKTATRFAKSTKIHQEPKDIRDI